MSRVDPNVVTDILEDINKNSGDMVISRGDTQDFLCMTIKISNNKKVELIMKRQIKDMVSQFKYTCDVELIFPCKQTLWDINNEAELLDDVKGDLFNLLAAKLLYITKITRPDIEPSMVFFTKKVA